MWNWLKRKHKDETLEDQLKDYLLLQELSRTHFIKLMGENCDNLRGAQGVFGRSPKNPIPVNGPPGEIKYLARLRCACGCALMFHRLGSSEVDGIKGNVDVYECVCLKGKHWDLLYLHPYHPRRSVNSPTGYIFSKFHPVFSRLVLGCGGNTFCPDFPFQLLTLIQTQYDPQISTVVLETIAKAILEPSRFQRPREHGAGVAAVSRIDETQATQILSPMDDEDQTRLKDFMKHGQFNQALSMLNNLPVENRKHWNTIYLVGQCYRYLGDYPAAVEHLTKAAAAEPNEPPIQLALGIALQLQGKFDDSINVLMKAINLNPDYALAYNSLALTQKKCGLLHEAAATYQSGLKALSHCIAKGMVNSPSNPILKHIDTIGQQWVEYAIYAAMCLVSTDGIDVPSWPTGDMAMEEEKSEAHEGLYYIDGVASDGKRTRLFLPNFFNTFRETLCADRAYSDLIGNRGAALEQLGRTEEADLCYREAEEFEPCE